MLLSQLFFNAGDRGELCRGGKSGVTPLTPRTGAPFLSFCLIGSALLAGCATEPPRPARTVGVIPPTEQERGASQRTEDASSEGDRKDREDRMPGAAGAAGGDVPSNESPTSPQLDESEPLPPNGYSFAEVIDVAQEKLLALQQKVAIQSSQLAVISEINQSYCERWSEQQTTCAGLISLQAEGPAMGETCNPNLNVSQDKARLQVSTRWESKSSGLPDFTFYLRANDTFRTNDLTLGKRQNLVWTPLAGAPPPVESPSIYEVKKLELVASGATLPEQSQGQIVFELLVDDYPVLITDNLLPWEPGDTRIRINTIPLAHLIQAPGCVITQNDLAVLAESIREKHEEDLVYGGDGGGSPEPKPVVDANAPADELATQLQDIRNQIEAGEQKLAESQTLIDREYDRNGKLRRLLLTEYRSGCKANEKIETLEIFLTGSRLPDSDWDRTATDAEKKTEGQPQAITFSFSREIQLTHSDEVSNPLFTSSGYISSADFSSFTVSDLQYLRIKKGGRGYSSDLNCWSIIGWSKWGLGKNCEWQNRETHRYNLQHLLVKLNGQPFLRFSNLAFDFSGTQDTWQESNLATSSEYVEFMTSSTCTNGGN